MRVVVGATVLSLFAAAGTARGQVPERGTPPQLIDGGTALDVPAVGAEATGRVQTFEPERRVLTLDNGDTYVLAANAPGTETLTPGVVVTLTYTIDGANRIAREVRAITAVPEADAPAPRTVN